MSESQCQDVDSTWVDIESGDCRDPSLDISNEVEKEGDYYIKNGEFSDVWEGFHIVNGLKIRVAIKVLRGAPSHNHELHRLTRKKLNKAGRKWKDLKHQNILPFYGIAYNFGYLPAMVCKFCKFGNVVEYIASKKIEGDELISLMTGVVRGLEHLHANGVIHGDLRGANVLIDERGLPVLSDFGLTFVIDHGEFTTNKIAGPARWTAPEILDPPSEMENEPPYSEKSDIFAFAMTAMEIYTGKAPYNRIRNDSAVIFQILKNARPEIPELLREKPDVQKVIEDCWKQDPSDRPDTKSVLKALQQAIKPDDSAPGWFASIWSAIPLRRFFGAWDTNNGP